MNVNSLESSPTFFIMENINKKECYNNDLLTLKAGEIYINKDTIICYCCHCPETFKNIFEFGYHLEKVYKLNLVERTNKAIDIKVEKSHIYDINDTSKKLLDAEYKFPEQPLLCTKIDSSAKLEVLETNLDEPTNSTKIRLRRKKHPAFSSPDPIYIVGENDSKRLRYPCPYCNKNYGSKRKQRQHISFHLGINPLYKCEQCGACLKSSSTLKSHIRIHTGERPYQCDLCKKKFSTKSGFLNHNSIHVNEKNFNCSNCGKKFKSKYQLQLHERIHSGEKPYQCDVCGIKFNCSSKLNEHNKRHLNIRSHVCEMCRKSFYTKQQMESHKISHTKEKKFICHICELSFARSMNLKQHERIHSDNKDYKCKLCHELFFRYSTVYYHMKTQHSGLTKEYEFIPKSLDFQCNGNEICKQVEENFNLIREKSRFNFLKMLNLTYTKCGEIYYSNDNFIYNCIFCDKQINDIQQFQSHFIQSHKLNNIKTEICSFKLVDDYCELKLDIQRNRDSENISIPKNPDVALLPSLKKTEISNREDDKTNIHLNIDETGELHELKLDMQLSPLSISEKHDNLDSPSPEETEVLSRKRDDYKINSFNAEETDHKQLTETECVQINSRTSSIKRKIVKCKQYPCEICGRIYQRPKKLKSHMETHTPGYLTCTICEKILSNKRNLKIHLKLHNGETFDCTICNAKFSRKGNLKQHMLRHQKEKPFACKYENCNLRFINNSILRAHELIHTGEKPLVCEFCGRSFINITALKEHIKRHTNQRDFKCSHCDKKFFDKKLLKDHEIGHTGIKNFVCNICSVYFLRKKSLTCHMKKHSDIKNYKCKICNDCFSLYNDLAYHIKKKHNVTKISNKI